MIELGKRNVIMGINGSGKTEMLKKLWVESYEKNMKKNGRYVEVSDLEQVENIPIYISSNRIELNFDMDNLDKYADMLFLKKDNMTLIEFYKLEILDYDGHTLKRLMPVFTTDPENKAEFLSDFILKERERTINDFLAEMQERLYEVVEHNKKIELIFLKEAIYYLQISLIIDDNVYYDFYEVVKKMDYLEDFYDINTRIIQNFSTLSQGYKSIISLYAYMNLFKGTKVKFELYIDELSQGLDDTLLKHLCSQISTFTEDGNVVCVTDHEKDTYEYLIMDKRTDKLYLVDNKVLKEFDNTEESSKKLNSIFNYNPVELTNEQKAKEFLHEYFEYIAMINTGEPIPTNKTLKMDTIVYELEGIVVPESMSNFLQDKIEIYKGMK